MNSPIAIIISDIHYNVQTLEVADKAMRLAINHANKLNVPLVVAGDLHDTKANVRGECIKAMIETFKLCNIPPIVLRGNHDSINEKSAEHSLEFLTPYASIVKHPVKNLIPYWTFIPYHHDPDELRVYLKTLPTKSNIIMHQGLTSSLSGDYIQDKSSINPEDVAGHTVISGHYHTRQHICTPNGGTWNYVGNPYTLTFGEANDPDKGYQILYDTGVLEFIPTHLRRHIIVEADETTFGTFGVTHQLTSDLYWVKIKGSSEWLSTVTKEIVDRELSMCGRDFRLDLIPTETKSTLSQGNANFVSQAELLDSMIDSLNSTSDEQKTRLKNLWKELR